MQQTQALYIYSEAEILKQKFIEQQQQYIKQQNELSKNPNLGPGAYDPDFKQVKKAAPATDWASSKAAQRAGDTAKTTSPAQKKSGLLEPPGPGTYEVGAAGKIGGTQPLKDQADIERRRKANNFNHYKLLQ
jgi:Sperm-tail PG-rich repeat